MTVKKYLVTKDNLSIEDRLHLTAFRVDDEAHLVVDPEVCRTCPHRACAIVCPARNYTVQDDGSVIVSYEGCLECGACRIVCTPGGLTWQYPRGGMGVALKKG